MFPSAISLERKVLSETLSKRKWGAGTSDEPLTINDPLAPSGLNLEKTIRSYYSDPVNDPGIVRKPDQYIKKIEQNGHIPLSEVESLIECYSGLQNAYVRMTNKEKKLMRYTIGFAIKAHKGETRKSNGERYSQHWLRIINRIATDASEFYDSGLYLTKAQRHDSVIPRDKGNIFFLDVLIGGAIHDVVEHKAKKEGIKETEAYNLVKTEFLEGVKKKYSSLVDTPLQADWVSGFQIAYIDTNKTGNYTSYLFEASQPNYNKGLRKRAIEGALIVKANDTTDNSNQLDHARKNEEYQFLLRSLIKSEFIINLIQLYFNEQMRTEGPITTMLWNTKERACAANYNITQRELEHFAQTEVDNKTVQKTILQGLNDYTLTGGFLDVTTIHRRKGTEDTIQQNMFHGYSMLFFNVLNENWTAPTKKYWQKIAEGNTTEIFRTLLVLHQLSIFNFAGKNYALPLPY